jgi:hypothetical protein
MNMTRLDRKGILSYITITFTITYAVEGVLIASGFRITRLSAYYGQLMIAAVMWVPALATWLTIKFVTREGPAILNLRFGSLEALLTYCPARATLLRHHLRPDLAVRLGKAGLAVGPISGSDT